MVITFPLVKKYLSLCSLFTYYGRGPRVLFLSNGRCYCSPSNFGFSYVVLFVFLGLVYFLLRVTLILFYQIMFVVAYCFLCYYFFTY